MLIIKKMKKLLYISIAAIALTSCQPEFNDPVDEQGFYSSGDADFSNFVAVGNSLTAGYAILQMVHCI